jgi:hypothetical protein
MGAAGCIALSLAAAGLVGCGESPTTDSPPSTNATPPPAASAPAGTDSAADQAWTSYQELFTKPPEPPATWNTETPSDDAIREFKLSRGEAASKVADGARDFYTRHPDDARAKAARDQERQLLDAAVQLGYTNATTRLEELEQGRLKDPDLTEDERLELKMGAAHRTAAGLFSQGEDAARTSLEQSAKDLIQEFPNRPEPYHLL